jgi:hypothetical protein
MRGNQSVPLIERAASPQALLSLMGLHRPE